MPTSARTIRHTVTRGTQRFRHFRVLQNEGIREGAVSCGMQAMNELSDLRREVENLRVLLNDERSGVAAELRKLEKRIER